MRDYEKTAALVRLAAGVSHELNNIFMVIDGNLSLVSEEGGLPQPIREMVTESLTAARRGIGLSKNLQAYAGRRPLRSVPVDLRLIVKTVLRSLRHELSAIEIRLAMPESPCMVRIDPQHAEAILLELARNAHAAMPSGGTLVVELALVEPRQLQGEHDGVHPSEAVRLSITDNGPGLPPEALARATEPMFTLKKGAGARAGWGLSIVDGFIRQSGGTLSLTTAGTGGTQVDIYLPVAPAG